MRIGFLTSDLSHRHGWAHYSLSLTQALRKRGVALTVVAPHNSPDVEGLTVYKLLPAVTPADSNLLLKQTMIYGKMEYSANYTMPCLTVPAS